MCYLYFQDPECVVKKCVMFLPKFTMILSKTDFTDNLF